MSYTHIGFERDDAEQAHSPRVRRREPTLR
jgi:hypothetical protein